MSSEKSSLKDQSPLPNYTNLDEIQLTKGTQSTAVEHLNDNTYEVIVTQPRKSDEREQDDEPRRSSDCCDFCCNPDVDDPIANAAIAGCYCPLILCHPNSNCDCSPDCRCEDCFKCTEFCVDCICSINWGDCIRNIDCDDNMVKCLGLLFCCPVFILVGMLTSGDCKL